MRVAIAGDHAGFTLKQKLIPELREQGYEVTDLGATDERPVDYLRREAAGRSAKPRLTMEKLRELGY